MPILEYLRISKDKKLLLLGISEEGERSRYTVGEAFYHSIGSPGARSVLNEETLAAIMAEDERIRAAKKALSILAYADNNERTLTDKLRRAGFSREVAADTARQMVGLGYIDEERQLRRMLLREANINLLGFSRILPKLVAKGYAAAEVRRITSELVAEGEISFKDNAKRLIEKKLPEGATSEEKKSLLYKNGYKI